MVCNYNTKEEFVKGINKIRRDNKNKWYMVGGTVNGKEYKIKGYGTWLQIFLFDNMSYSGGMDISVKEFTDVLNSPFGQ